MEFIIAIAVFAIAFVFLSLGRIMGRKHELHSCGSGKDNKCVSCGDKNADDDHLRDDAGLSNAAMLGNPNRKNRFIDKLDFRPEKLE